MRWSLAVLLILGASPLAGQEPALPAGQGPTTALGLFGFGVMGGVDFQDGGQAIAAVTLDAGHLFTDRFRIRPSAEIGFLGGDTLAPGGDNTYVANFELVYRITDDTQLAVPYLGTGLALRGRDECGADPECPKIWLQFVLGFEVRLRPHISWLLEYHPADALRRQRVFIGLTTRRGT